MVKIATIGQWLKQHKLLVLVSTIVIMLVSAGGWWTYTNHSSVASSPKQVDVNIKGSTDDVAAPAATQTTHSSNPEQTSSSGDTANNSKKTQTGAATGNPYDFSFDKQSVSVLGVQGFLSSPVTARASDPNQQILWEVSDNPMAKFGAGSIVYDGDPKNTRCAARSTCTLAFDPSHTPVGTYTIKLSARFFTGQPNLAPPTTPLTKTLTVVITQAPTFKLNISATQGGPYDRSSHRIINIPFTIDAPANYGFPITVKSGFWNQFGQFNPATAGIDTYAYLTDQSHGVLVVEIYGNPNTGRHSVELQAISRIGSQTTSYSFDITE